MRFFFNPQHLFLRVRRCGNCRINCQDVFAWLRGRRCERLSLHSKTPAQHRRTIATIAFPWGKIAFFNAVISDRSKQIDETFCVVDCSDAEKQGWVTSEGSENPKNASNSFYYFLLFLTISYYSLLFLLFLTINFWGVRKSKKSVKFIFT